MEEIYFYGADVCRDVHAVNRIYKGIDTPIDLYNALKKVWCADTCAPRLRKDWIYTNPTLGQCSITAFLAQDIFGGEVFAILTENGDRHCYNRVGNIVFDLTSEQFGEAASKLVYACQNLQDRESESQLARQEKRERYEYLKRRLPKHVEGHMFFARHGQTEGNVQKVVCGSVETGLTEKGIEMARGLAKKIIDENIKIDEILYSPLSRARDTALEISKMTGIPARLEERLVEQDFGVWEHKYGKVPEFAEAKRNFVMSYGGGESALFLCQRIYNLIDDIKKQNDKVFLLVSHGGVARAVYSYFHEMTNEEYASYALRNCELVRFDFD